MRFQQTTGPVMAKGVEDTTFYIYNRFVALNEVGGDPGRFGMTVADFHEAMTKAQRDRPSSMLATSTHDTKRSEDVRARLALLSEMPDEWRTTLLRWRAMNAAHRQDAWPDANMEYLLYQTLVGAWPLSVERAQVYAQKAAREAKVHTSWTDPDPVYESALRDFIAAILGDDRFQAELGAFTEPLEAPGRTNSLALTLVKLTAPGVPDIYQGTEIWDLSLVDPDNRHPVDHAGLNAMLQGLETEDEASARDHRGGAKLYVINKALGMRARFPDAFAGTSTYAPLAAQGSKKDHVVAFVRGGQTTTVVPRLVWSLAKEWGDTSLELPAGSWRDELSGETFSGVVPLSSLTARMDVALLVRLDEGEASVD